MILLEGVSFDQPLLQPITNPRPLEIPESFYQIPVNIDAATRRIIDHRVGKGLYPLLPGNIETIREGYQTLLRAGEEAVP